MTFPTLKPFYNHLKLLLYEIHLILLTHWLPEARALIDGGIHNTTLVFLRCSELIHGLPQVVLAQYHYLRINGKDVSSLAAHLPLILFVVLPFALIFLICTSRLPFQRRTIDDGWSAASGSSSARESPGPEKNTAEINGGVTDNLAFDLLDFMIINRPDLQLGMFIFPARNHLWPSSYRDSLEQATIDGMIRLPRHHVEDDVDSGRMRLTELGKQRSMSEWEGVEWIQ